MVVAQVVPQARHLEEMDHPYGDRHMKAKIQMTIRTTSPLLAIRAAAMVALFALTSAVALADQPPATRIANVSLAGLDLSTPEGARAAYERIKTTAERLCFQVESDPFPETYARCVRETLADVIRRINARTLAALAN
jgi:UrcA family protein